MSAKREVSFEGKIDLDRAADYLEEIADSLKAGKLVVESGREVLVLQPSEVVKLEVEAESKKDEEELKIELKWSRLMVAEGEPALRISSVEPASAALENPSADEDEEEAEEEHPEEPE